VLSDGLSCFAVFFGGSDSDLLCLILGGTMLVDICWSRAKYGSIRRMIIRCSSMRMLTLGGLRGVGGEKKT
jgi:hypothetical protein